MFHQKNLLVSRSYHIIGASGHAKVIIETLEKSGATIAGITDSNPEVTSLFDYEVVPNLPQGFQLAELSFIIAIGNNQIRKGISLNNILNYGVALHPSANLSTRISIGAGTVVMAGVTINAECVISDHCIINTNVSIDHECRINSFAHISPNVALAGNVCVGEGVHIGIGASVVHGIKIGKWATIGAGAVIIRDVPDYAVVVGVPGKIIKYNENNER